MGWGLEVVEILLRIGESKQILPSVRIHFFLFFFWNNPISEAMADMSAWEVLGVPKEVQRGLSEQGFTSPTPIQTLSLPPAISHHRDIIGAAETVS